MHGRLASETEWQQFMERALAEPVIALCLHTTGPDPLTAQIAAIAFATSADNVVLPTRHMKSTELCRLLAPLLAGKQRVKAFHNAKAALRFLLRSGLVLERIFDSMLADQLLSAGHMLQEPSLYQTAARHLGSQRAEAVAAVTQPTLQDETPALAAAQVIFELRNALIPKLVAQGLVRCAQIEFECAGVTADIENAGIRLDEARLRHLVERGRRNMEQAALDFTAAFAGAGPQLFGQAAAINIGSDTQLAAFLRTHGIPVQRVSARALAPFMSAHPQLQYIIAYRQAAHERSLESYLNFIHPATGRAHPTYTQLAAATGRYGCANPAIQSFPRTPEHRACVLPAPGRSFVIADYSQIELRIAAQISRDKRMLEAFAAGMDLHRLTAAILMDKAPEAVSPAERQAAKAVNFGLIYSMGARSLVEYAQQQYGVEMTQSEAEQFRARYFRAYQGVSAWHNEVRRNKPALVRTLSGRARRVADASLPIALNSPVQGSGADILKQALTQLLPELRPLGAHIVAVVHDEIIVESPQTQAPAVKSIMERVMPAAAALFLPDVPCPVEAHIGKTWADKS